MPKIEKQNPTSPKTAKTVEEDDLWGKLLNHTLLWGMAGTGKTTLAATWPAPILWLVCSGTTKPAGMQSINTEANRSRITPKLIQRVEQFTDISQDVALLSRYESVVLDHVGGLAELHLKEVLNLEEIPVVKNWGMASMDEYRLVSDRIKLSFSRFFSCAPSRIVILGHEKTYENKKRPEASFNGVSLGDKTGEWFHKLCDSVFQTYREQKYKTVTEEVNGETTEIQTGEKEGVEYRLRLGGDVAFATKFQSAKRNIPDYISNPTYDKLKKALGI